MTRPVFCSTGTRFYWLTAALAALAAAPASRGAFIASLDDISNASTFENATATTSPAPVGWTAVGSTGIRAFKGTNGTNSIMIASGATSTANFTAQYDTGMAIQPDMAYTLSAEIGFSTTSTPGSGINGFAVIFGELSNGAFTALASDNGSTPYQYSANLTAPYYSDDGVTEFTTGSSVDSQDIAVQLARTSPDGTAWLGFDNVTLDATRVPEPAAALLAPPLMWIARRRRSRR